MKLLILAIAIWCLKKVKRIRIDMKP